MHPDTPPDQSRDQPTDQAVEKNAETPGDNSAKRSAGQLVDKPAEEGSLKSAERVTDEKAAQAPVQPVTMPAATPAVAQASTPVAQPLSEGPTIASAPSDQIAPSEKIASPTQIAPSEKIASPTAKVAQPQSDDAERQIRRLSRRGFAVAGGAAAAAFAGWYWLDTRSVDNGIFWPLRRSLQVNDALASALFKDSRLAPTFPAEQAQEPRVNGQYGLEPKFDPAKWKLRVEDPAGNKPRNFALHEIQALPRAEMVTELKCIEGWSEVVQWAGVRLADFLAHYQLGRRADQSLFDFVQMESVGGGYYVGLDMASAMHPQTLLCYEMNGNPLTLGHGAPLRLVIPVKYGIKNIKRIATLRFLDARPADFWAERGYDWYAGL